MRETLWVSTESRRYPVYIGSDLLKTTLLQQHIVGQQAMVVASERVANLYLDNLLKNPLAPQVDTHILPDGEQYKILESVIKIWQALLDRHHHRQTTLIALGGGVITDLTGFAAACYQRGVHFISIPTSLLSQVDASIGGKTGVNFQQGKNLIGAFHPPHAVVIDLDLLKTLPEREYCSGIAEIIKSALIADAEFFVWLEENMAALVQREPSIVRYAIIRSLKIKRHFVEIDERESGQRALLNFGHTFGHVIEAVTGYASWLHGEAISMGMVMALDYSRRIGQINNLLLKRVVILLKQAKLPTHLSLDIPPDEFITQMADDKKAEVGQLKLILLIFIGQAYVCDDVDNDCLKATVHFGLTGKEQ